MQRVYDSQSRPVSLGRELGRGGEGSVFEVVGHPNLVAKVYHKAADAERASKLAAMVSLRTDRLLSLAAWPVETLHSSLRGPVVGLLMPKVTGFKEIHKLYGPKTRLAEFPAAEWTFLIHAAGNLARAFRVIHEHGHVIGDVNHANIVVSDRATVMLIDCDSFQVSAHGRCYLCKVGVSTHQPPELQALSSFAGVTRTPNHDDFGLAVLIFQLLFMGRHPFAGRYLGTGEMPIERAIREHRFAYGRSAAARQMKPPPGALPLSAVSPGVASLFERAFAPDGYRTGARPSAEEWISALKLLSERLRSCARNPAHRYLSDLPTCPWCAIEASAGTLLFNLVIAQPPPSTFDVSGIWAQITAVRAPAALPSLNSLFAAQLQVLQTLRQQGSSRGIFGSISATVKSLDPMYRARRAIAQQAADEARARWTAVETRWQAESSDQTFQRKWLELENARREYLDLPAQRRTRLQHLEAQRRDRQLHRFLDRHRLDVAQISGIGPGRKTTLQSYGIETAADVSEGAIAAVPGFGPKLTAKLIAWRRSIVGQFQFDPRQGVDPRDIAAVDRDLLVARSRLEQVLRDGVAQLTQLASQATARRQLLQTQAEQALSALIQAERTLNAL